MIKDNISMEDVKGFTKNLNEFVKIGNYDIPLTTLATAITALPDGDVKIKLKNDFVYLLRLKATNIFNKMDAEVNGLVGLASMSKEEVESIAQSIEENAKNETH